MIWRDDKSVWHQTVVTDVLANSDSQMSAKNNIVIPWPIANDTATAMLPSKFVLAGALADQSQTFKAFTFPLDSTPKNR